MYYIYLHIREDTGLPFYIGKGKNKRYNSKSSRSTYWHNIVNKHGVDTVFLETNLSNKEAIIKEKYWINRIGRKDKNKGVLINFTDGGEGTIGKIVNKRTREAVALSNKTRKISNINRETTKNLFKGKLGKQHNRSIPIICNNIEYAGYSEASRQLKLPIHVLYYRVNSLNIKWVAYQIKKNIVIY